MFSVDIAFNQPAFFPSYFLNPAETRAFHRYFSQLEHCISNLQVEAPDTPETSLTAWLVHSINGNDSVAKQELHDTLGRISPEVAVAFRAKELPWQSQRKGESLDFLAELKVRSGDRVLAHRNLLIEAKRLYPIAGRFSFNSRFKELNKLELDKRNIPSVRSALQARTMIQHGPRSGVFALYCPTRIDGRTVGTRVLFPETMFLLPAKPTLEQVYGDSSEFAHFMIEHFFCGRRGIESTPIRRRLEDSTTHITYIWTIDIQLPKGRSIESRPVDDVDTT